MRFAPFLVAGVFASSAGCGVSLVGPTPSGSAAPPTGTVATATGQPMAASAAAVGPAPAGSAAPTAVATATPGPATPVRRGFAGRIHRAGVPQAGRMIVLRRLEGREGELQRGAPVDGSAVAAGADGTFFVSAPPEQRQENGLRFVRFGVGYGTSAQDAPTPSGQEDEILEFQGSDVDLDAMPGQQYAVEIDLVWDPRRFVPALGATIAGPDVRFEAPARTGAEGYELLVLAGDRPGAGEPVFHVFSPTPTFTWPGAAAGTYHYQLVALQATGVERAKAHRAIARWVKFSVRR